MKLSISAALGLPALLCLAGCGARPTFVSGAISPVNTGTHGTVHGGNQPIYNAQIQLFAAGHTGNGLSPASLLIHPVATASDGSFNITNDYTCPTGDPFVYLTATGGDPGIGGATNNPSLAMMVTGGTCSELLNTQLIQINEVTTVASVWALAPFLSPGMNLGASPTNTAGLALAFQTIRSLVDTGTAAFPGPALPAQAYIDPAKLLTLADAITPCINSAGGVICTSLFTAATAGGVTPANTIDAVLNIVTHPDANPVGVFNQVSASPPFQPALTAAPDDWTLAIVFGGALTTCSPQSYNGLCGPTTLAVDADGSVVVANYYSAVSKFSNAGDPLYNVTDGGLFESYGLALDLNNAAWIVNEEANGTGTVTEIASSGTIESPGAGYTAGGVYYPVGIATDTDGSVWVADFGRSLVSKLNNDGSAVSGSPFSGSAGQISFPVAVAVDGAHNAWFANQSSLAVTKISQDGSSVASYVCCSGAADLTVDSHQNVWVANYFGDSISELKNDGTVLLNRKMGAGVLHPQGIAVDGAGTVWVANYRGDSISALAGADAAIPGAPLTTLGLGRDIFSDSGMRNLALEEPYGIAVDSSGSIWVSNFGSGSVVKFVGLGIPVKTPLVGPVQVP